MSSITPFSEWPDRHQARRKLHMVPEILAWFKTTWVKAFVRVPEETVDDYLAVLGWKDSWLAKISDAGGKVVAFGIIETCQDSIDILDVVFTCSADDLLRTVFDVASAQKVRVVVFPKYTETIITEGGRFTDNSEDNDSPDPIETQVASERNSRLKVFGEFVMGRVASAYLHESSTVLFNWEEIKRRPIVVMTKKAPLTPAEGKRLVDIEVGLTFDRMDVAGHGAIRGLGAHVGDDRSITIKAKGWISHETRVIEQFTRDKRGLVVRNAVTRQYMSKWVQRKMVTVNFEESLAMFVPSDSGCTDVCLKLVVAGVNVTPGAPCRDFRITKYSCWTDPECITNIILYGSDYPLQLFLIDRLELPRNIHDGRGAPSSVQYHDICNIISRLPPSKILPAGPWEPAVQLRPDPTASSESNASVDNNVGYIYLIREREFFLRKEDVYKIGMTIQAVTQRIRRLDDYKKGSELILVAKCSAADVAAIERDLKRDFAAVFQRHSDGTEYFVGDPQMMARMINAAVWG